MKKSTTLIILVILAVVASTVVAWAKFGTPRQPSNTTNAPGLTLELEVTADRRQLKLTPTANKNGAVTVGAPGEQATITVRAKNVSGEVVDNLSIEITTDEQAALIVGMPERLDAGSRPNSYVWKVQSLSAGAEQAYSFTMAVTSSSTDRLIFKATARSGTTVLAQAQSSPITIVQ